MFGRRAVELIRELDRTDEDQLLPYDVDTVGEVVREVQEHVKEVYSVLRSINRDGADEATMVKCSAAIVIHHNSIRRNKRCILAYLNHRLQKINGLRWQLGAVLPEDIQAKLSQPERAAFKSYSDSLADYMASVGMDLTVDAVPPKDPYIEARVLQATGPLLVDDKVLHLTPNSVHLFKRADAEPLIMQGYLEHRLY